MLPDDDLAYAASIYTAKQLEPHAIACRTTGCPSYIHCFFGRPRGDNTPPLPVCAARTLARLESTNSGS